ncbi:MAG TPA: hypothetical protein VMJ11_24955 [Paraburkholderia sp.]|uniref:hypothetical protein n=1 Tax=Paraburkholderia sp. TaxID=1926495 RepID=UPI002CA64B78|nr:hypothetical protein [Paraburkholderia sp.]HTR09847.1 hypothetical protein [Paraburkholderia sp.]
MTCLNEKIVGAVMLMLSGYAFADGTFMNAPETETMTVANIAPVPMEVVPSLPEPQAYLQRYELEYQGNQPKPFYAQVESFYSAPVAHDKYHYQFEKGVSGSDSGSQFAAHSSSSYLHFGPSTAPQISIVQIPDPTLTLGAQPQRRLSLTVDDWVFSATARLAVLHSHDSGATISVRHGFSGF